MNRFASILALSLLPISLSACDSGEADGYLLGPANEAAAKGGHGNPGHGVIASARGRGHVTVLKAKDGVIEFDIRFTAMDRGDGVVGRFSYSEVVRDPFKKDGFTTRSLSGDITCVVFDKGGLKGGTTATIFAVLDPTLEKKLPHATWTVSDGGNGKGATDFVSQPLVGLFKGTRCDDGPKPLPVHDVLQPIDRGNIQVSPPAGEIKK